MVTGLAFAVGMELYMTNDVLFYPEYWLQRKIDRFEQEPTNLQRSKKKLTYRFQHDQDIDLMITLSDNEVIRLTRCKWISGDVAMKKEIEFQVNTGTFEHLKEQFMALWSKSRTEAEDYRLGRTGYELSLEAPGKEPIAMAYYNVVPGDTLISFKKKLILLSEQFLDR